MSEGAGRPPPEYLDAILDAARSARIGVGIALREGAGFRTVWFNDAAAEILGWPLEDLLTRDLFSLTAPDEREATRARAEARARGVDAPTTFTTAAISASGARVPLRVSVSRVQVGGRDASVFFFEDDRARLAAAAALVESEARFRRLVETAPDGVVITRNGEVLYANPAAARQLGRDRPEEVIGLRLHEMLDPPGDALVMRDRIRAMTERGERLAPREYRLRRADGSTMVAEITSHPIEYEGGIAVLAIARDLTERLRMQEHLVRADRLAALGTLAAGVAHEINNPLAFVSLGIDALERQVARAIPDPQLREETLALLDPIRAGSGRVAEIVRDLLLFSRPGETAPGPIAIGHAIEAAQRIAGHELRHRARLEIDCECTEGGGPLVIGHAARLEQVIVNLLVNAAQAFPEGARDPRVRVRCRAHDGAVTIEVEDNGPGIAEEVRGRVFDPFVTTKPAGVGTGLGLSVCHGIVTRMGGTISIDSAPGRGTTVRIRLPSASVSASASAAGEAPRADAARARPAPDSEPAPARLRVLVVDDEPALGRALRSLLAREHEVTVVGDGESALAAIVAAGEAAFDVVLCDVMMPGMTGPELYQRVLDRAPALARRFVLMTGGALTPSTAAFLAEFPLPRLDKPFSPAQLRAALARAASSSVPR